MANRTPQRNTRTTRNNRYHQTPRRYSFAGLFKWLFSFALLGGLVVGALALLSYLGYLDHNVRKQFEGKRWALPAYVYANASEFYVGVTSDTLSFERLLQQLRYRQDSELSAQGSYIQRGQQFYLRTRAFQFPDQQQAEQSVRITFANNTITQIVQLPSETPLPVLRLDPVQIGSFYPQRKEDRVLIKLDQAPQALIHGLLATEDRDFYSHRGVSLRAISRALWVNARAGNIVQGGSTITQQLIKNFYLTSERSLVRKINEVLMALLLEYRYGKDEILEAYLNEVYLGQDGASAIHGFGLASEFYFGRPLQNLPLHQIAMLVALVRGPSYYDPRRQSERAKERRNLVLREMQTQGYLDLQQSAVAQNMPLDLVPYQRLVSNRYPAFLDLVKRQLRETYQEADLTSEGLRIFTTLDVAIQEALDAAVKRKLPELEKRAHSNQLQTAALVTQRDSGDIVALTGGRNIQDTGFNRALDAHRAIGSLVKPAVYLTALGYPDRYTIITPVSDTALQINVGQDTPWEPHNYDHKEHGVVALHKALAQSYNLATVRVGMDIGLEKIAQTMQQLGVSQKLTLLPSLLLGASELSPLEVTQMYQTLAADGFNTPLRAIRTVIDLHGKVLKSNPLTVRQTLDPAAAYITNTILQEVMRNGTAKAVYASLPRELELVGKTGTTNEMRDSWFAGFSGDYLSVFWVGRDDNKPAGLTGATGALPIWTALMQSIAKQPVSLIAPDNIKMVWLQNGKLSTEDCPGSIAYPFIADSAPNGNAECFRKLAPPPKPIVAEPWLDGSNTVSE